ncbi:hypothetical protein SteCoe_35346 [Stentor coeruleus]|uniref:START domain-containing protein n=1 Tax=Stentor coeruleus TaxID=5963 RepID=A0A1R2ASH4_9CILI|nr:hypothetical protein SteCoe_35346 [Stentor coeruleus]
MEASLNQRAKETLDRAMNDLKEVNESGGWEVFGHGKKIEQMRKPSDVLFLIRGVCTIPLDHETVKAFVEKPENRPKFFTDISEVRVLETLSDGSQITLNVIKCPPGVSDRESITVCGVRVDDEENIYIAERSIDYGHPVQDGKVRVDLHMSGFVIQPVGPRECTLAYIFNLDPKGALPEAFVNLVQKKQAKVPGIVRELLKSGER